MPLTGQHFIDGEWSAEQPDSFLGKQPGRVQFISSGRIHLEDTFIHNSKPVSPGAYPCPAPHPTSRIASAATIAVAAPIEARLRALN